MYKPIILKNLTTVAKAVFSAECNHWRYWHFILEHCCVVNTGYCILYLCVW